MRESTAKKKNQIAAGLKESVEGLRSIDFEALNEDDEEHGSPKGSLDLELFVRVFA